METRQEEPARIPVVESGPFEDFPIIDSYTRAQAIEDGVLVDVSDTATECGFSMPVALTSAVFNGYIVPDDRSRPFGQTERGRLWDTLSMLRLRILLHGKGDDSSILYFRVMYVLKIKQRRVIVLKCHCGPGDNAEPVLTIMLPNED